MPAVFQKRNSAACVPLLSPRETNSRLSNASVLSASTMSLPLVLAGSALGPINTKSLYMTSKRLTAKPSATTLSSATLSCTNSTSASPRRPMSMACPVPSATTFTSIPLAFLNSGSRCENRPDCSVDVVEATTIDCACTPTDATETVATNATRTRARGLKDMD